ncbi:MAG: HAD-IA family hydrolase [Bacteriovoracaceae bacterium]|nr:HAD-IA family hydrolase [Bacteriovoracaceae bacterium]
MESQDFDKYCVVFDHDGTLVNTTPLLGEKVHVYPGILEILQLLSQKNIDLYIWSARPRSSLIRITKELGILAYFRDVRGSDDTLPKPHPAGLKEITETYPKSHVVHIGDGAGDYNGAKLLDIPFIAACWNDPTYGNKWRELFALENRQKMAVALEPQDILDFLKQFKIID